MVQDTHTRLPRYYSHYSHFIGCHFTHATHTSLRSPTLAPSPSPLDTPMSAMPHPFHFRTELLCEQSIALSEFIWPSHLSKMRKYALAPHSGHYPSLLPPVFSLYTIMHIHWVSFAAILPFDNFLKNNSQGGALPKRDIVDPFTHASCATGPNMAKHTSFPTTWGKAERAKMKGLVVREIRVVVTYQWPQWKVCNAWTAFWWRA